MLNFGVPNANPRTKSDVKSGLKVRDLVIHVMNEKDTWMLLVIENFMLQADRRFRLQAYIPTLCHTVFCFLCRFFRE